MICSCPCCSSQSTFCCGKFLSSQVGIEYGLQPITGISLYGVDSGSIVWCGQWKRFWCTHFVNIRVLLLNTSVGHDHQDCHENKMATPLNVLYYISNVYISIKTVGYSTYEGLLHLWFANNGQASWTINGRQRYQQGTKPVSVKLANCSYSYSSFSYSYSHKEFIPQQHSHGSRYFSIKKMKELHLLFSSALWWKRINRMANYLIYSWIRKKTVRP